MFISTRHLNKYNKYKKPFYGIYSGNYGFLMNKFSEKTLDFHIDPGGPGDPGGHAIPEDPESILELNIVQLCTLFKELLFCYTF